MTNGSLMKVESSSFCNTLTSMKQVLVLKTYFLYFTDYHCRDVMLSKTDLNNLLKCSFLTDKVIYSISFVYINVKLCLVLYIFILLISPFSAPKSPAYIVSKEG